VFSPANSAMSSVYSPPNARNMQLCSLVPKQVP
jgi:hypothetical protein